MDASILDVLEALFPVSSADVHVDPFIRAIALGVGGLTALVALALLSLRRYRAAVFLAVAVAGAVLLSSVVKPIVERPPIEGAPDEYSFPSGNATWSMATVTALLLLARSPRARLPVISAGAALVIGVGAVIAWEEWHYPSDVLAGWFLALGWVAGLWLLLKRPRA